MLPWTWGCRYFLKRQIAFLWDVYPRSALTSQGTSGCLPLLAYLLTVQPPLVEDTALESAQSPCSTPFTSFFQGLFANSWVPRVRLHSQRWSSTVMMAGHLTISAWWLLLRKPLWALRTEHKTYCRLHTIKWLFAFSYPTLQLPDAASGLVCKKPLKQLFSLPPKIHQLRNLRECEWNHSEPSAKEEEKIRSPITSEHDLGFFRLLGKVWAAYFAVNLLWFQQYLLFWGMVSFTFWWSVIVTLKSRHWKK